MERRRAHAPGLRRVEVDAPEDNHEDGRHLEPVPAGRSGPALGLLVRTPPAERSLLGCFLLSSLGLSCQENPRDFKAAPLPQGKSLSPQGR